MTTKEKIALMNWCKEAVIAVVFYEAALQIEQMRVLKKND